MTKKYITDTGTHYFNLQTVATNGSVIAYSANIDTTVASQTLYSKTIKTTASAVDSGTATQGQVLTADGNGGASWENVGGGEIYNHGIYLRSSVSGNPSYCNVNIVSNQNSAYTLATFRSFLYQNGYTSYPKSYCVNGVYYDGSDYYLITGLYYYSNTLFAKAVKTTDYSITNSLTVPNINVLDYDIFYKI